jgi:hypothetical protein
MKKHCKKCHVEKPLMDFYKKISCRDGLTKVCKACIGSYRKGRLIVTLESRRAQAKRWARENKYRLAAAASRWQKKHPSRANANTAAYEASKIKATPKWSNRFFISEAYDLAFRRTIATGFEWQVDHIVPLRSKLVCGLHTEKNLQVIPRKENELKGNRVWPDMPKEVIA